MAVRRRSYNSDRGRDDPRRWLGSPLPRSLRWVFAARAAYSVGFTIVLPSRDTAAIRASTLPFSFAPVPMVIA
jgi:hypothetical protein